VAEQGDSRLFHAEGPLVVGKGSGDKTATNGRPQVLHIGMPENMITWALTPDLPTLKVQRTAFMAAVPYSQRFYIIDFLPETPDDVLAAFERVLAQCTSFAVANIPAGSVGEPATTPNAAAISPADQEQVEAASGQVYITTPETASKVRATSTALASGISHLGEHMGKGIVRAGEWYRKRSEGKQKNVEVSKAHMRRCGAARSALQVASCQCCARSLSFALHTSAGAPRAATLSVTHINTLGQPASESTSYCIATWQALTSCAPCSMDTAKSTTERVAAVTTSIAGKVGSAIGNAAYGAKESLKQSGAVKEGGAVRGLQLRWRACHAVVVKTKLEKNNCAQASRIIRFKLLCRMCSIAHYLCPSLMALADVLETAQVHRGGRKVKTGVIALIDVFDAMHDAARHVISTGAEETATCVQYRRAACSCFEPWQVSLAPANIEHCTVLQSSLKHSKYD
jgi:hypothetical protein